MINADKFEQIFGIYATELWAKSEKEFLEWLNSEAQEVKDIIYREDAIKSMANAIWHYPNELYTGLNSYEMCEALAKDGLMRLPSAEPDSEWRKKHYEISYNQGYVDACKYYENLLERKKGKWIEFPNHMAYKCSECGRIIQTTDGRRNVSKHYPFCHCGANMKGE